MPESATAPAPGVGAGLRPSETEVTSQGVGEPVASEWRDPIAPLRVLVACGWLTDAEARDPRMRVESASSSHVVAKIRTPDGRAAVVKQVPRAAALAGRSLRQEMFVYRLARSVPALVVALPRPLHIDEARQVLALRAVDGDAWGVTRPDVPGVVERLATLMADWHHATQETALWPSPARGILEMPDALELASSGRAPATRRLMTAIAADRDLAAVLRRARAAWQDRCLIHGDLRRENVLTSATPDGADVRVIDWELSGAGDPAWDLAGVLTEVTLETVREAREPNAVWAPQQVEVVSRFVRTYVARSSAQGGDGTAVEWTHVVSCTIARLLHVACEWAEMQVEEQADPRSSLLAAAQAMHDRHADLAWALSHWSGA